MSDTASEPQPGDGGRLTDTITAQQFIGEGYAEKIKQGECVVKYGYTSYLVDLEILNNEVWAIVSYEGVAARIRNSWKPDEKVIEVTWLPAAQTAPVTSAPGGEVGLPNIAGLKSALEASTQGKWELCHEGDCICGTISSHEQNFMIARTELNHFEDAPQNVPKDVITSNAKFIALAHNELPALLAYVASLQAALTREQQAAAGYKAALERIAGEYPNEKPERIPFDTGNSDDREEFGYSSGLWWLGEKARKALQQAAGDDGGG